MTAAADVVLSPEVAMDRLADVLRSSPDGLCELMANAVLPSWIPALDGLREQRGLVIEVRPCPNSRHPQGSAGRHLRFWWMWRPRGGAAA